MSSAQAPAPPRGSDFGLVILAACLWGASGPVGKLLGDHAHLHPLAVAMLRMAVGAVALLGYLAARGRLRPGGVSARGWRRIGLTGAFSALFEASFFSAIHLTSVGFTALIAIGSTPVMVALYTAVETRRRPGARLVAALALALAGLALLLSGSLDAGSQALAGAGLALLTGAAFAGVSIANREPVPGLGPVALTGWAFAVGTVLVMPLALAAGLSLPSDARGWALLSLLGVAFTAGAYIAYFLGLRTVPATAATVLTLLEPLVAALLGAWLLGERLGWPGAAGGALLGAAVVLLRPRRERR